MDIETDLPYKIPLNLLIFYIRGIFTIIIHNRLMIDEYRKQEKEYVVNSAYRKYLTINMMI